jgi:CRP-like cAMP-binding protein
VAAHGAVFGEMSALLDQPHGADVRALEMSEFHVADAATLLHDPAALLYVTTVLAQRIDAANRGFIELKSQLDAGEPRGLIEKTLDGIEGLLSAIGTGYLRAGAGVSGYPFA